MQCLIFICRENGQIRVRENDVLHLIVINGIKLYPDFTIMNPINGEIYIWEHFGLMEDEKYRKNAEQKLELYMRAGYYPMVNLIITTETADHPLDYGLVCDLIDHYFVSR